jgi:predicted dehydrogenase
MVSLGILGCGDVAFRTYFPALQRLAPDEARVTVCFDPVPDRAARAAALFPGARAVTTLADLLATPGLEGVFNLTPAPLHADTTRACLDAGLHVFTEKPLAASVEEAVALAAHAEARGRVLLGAPAVVATERWRWLRRAIAQGAIGRPTLATAQMANMGPAGWRAYTGDPAVFYRRGVGPFIDHGIYQLAAILAVFGPARRVQAMGGITIPQREVQIPRLAGQVIEVTEPDHMLVSLDFGDAFAQIVASFAVPRSKVPALEIHGTLGTISIPMSSWYDAAGPVDIFRRDPSPLGIEGWMEHVGSPEASGPGGHLIGSGPAHFVRVLRGEEAPLLTAAFATHTLEVMLLAHRAIAEGRALETTTTFTLPSA